MKKLICMVMAVLLLASLSAAAFADSGIGVEPGQHMADFTVSLTDGTTATLSELLKEKDLVVLNIFASWCGPCENEFPEMEKIYQANKDRMEIVAVSGYEDDTMEIISDYKASHNLSFPMGLAGEDLSYLNVPGYPTTFFIDKSGNVGFIKVGSFPSAEEFEGKVKIFLAADYDGKPLKTEQAVNILPYILLALVLGGVLLVIGRWCLLKKAGRPGWHGLIPILSSYEEYGICWNGWFGVAADLCLLLALFTNTLGLSPIIHHVLMAASVILGIPQSFKLAKAFGQSKLVGVLLMLPGLKEISRFVLGVSKAKYQPLASRV